MYSMQPIKVFADYFGDGNPVIVQHYTREKGWRRSAWRKRASRSWLLKLRKEGVEWIAVEANGRVADFTVKEILRG